MATIEDYLLELDKQRDQLAANLTAMGVPSTAEEKLNALVPRVLQIPTSGSGETTKTILFDANTHENIYLQHNSTIYSLSDFTALYPDFCGEENGYALDYNSSIFGWDVSVFTCSTTPISITAESQIAIRFLSNSSESGILRLVQSDTGTAEDILTKAQTEGSYTDLSLWWVYTTDEITTLSPCETVTPGTYYLVWVGRSNNARPQVHSVIAYF